MGKRGPTAKGEYTGKSAVLSTRINPELRKRLEVAVNQSGLTMSREVEHRLRRTFNDEDKAADQFGSVRNWRLLQLIGITMQTVFNPDNPNAAWLEDPWMFEQVAKRIGRVIEAVRPEGEIVQLKGLGMQPASELATLEMPARIWKGVQDADAALPLDASRKQHRANVIKADLGEVAQRPRVFYGDATTIRREADRVESAKKSGRNRTRGAKK